MSITNEVKSVVLWYLNGCSATFYKAQEDDEEQKKKETMDTVTFTNKAYLAYRQVSSLRIAAPAVPFLTNLSSLQLQNNNLTALPAELWRLTSLTELNLGFNQLKELPVEVGRLVNLREFFIHNNEISSIPSQIGNLNQLNVLDVTCNKLTYLPGELLLLNLKNLWIENNVFESEHREEEEAKFISLKSLCAQSIGVLCLEDEESRKVVQDTLDTVESLISIHSEILLVPRCYHCHQLLFHSGLDIIKHDRIPLLFKACSQNCYIKIANNLVQQ